MILQDIFEALKATLDNVTGCHAYAYEPADPSAPAIFPTIPTEGTYDDMFSPAGTFQIPVRLLVATIDDRQATNKLFSFMDVSGEQSVKATIEQDRTLGGTVDSAEVTGWQQVGRYSYASTEYLGCEFIVDILA